MNSHIYSSLNYKATEDANKLINILNGLLATLFFMVFGMKGFLFFPLNIAFHYYMRWLTNKDPWKRDAFNKYLQHADHYDPWLSDELKAYGDRPYGIGKGIKF